jgi:hypothetical protein
VDELQKRLTVAERDNDLIYHETVPPASTLPTIPHAVAAQPKADPRLTNPEVENPILGEMLGYGAQEAISAYSSEIRRLFLNFSGLISSSFHLDLYIDRRDQLIQNQIVNAAKDLNKEADAYVFRTEFHFSRA